MRFVLDTNRYTDLMSGVTEAVDMVESATEIFVPFAVLGELRAGFASGSRRVANDQVLDAFLRKPFVKAVYADEKTVFIYAALYSSLRQHGRTIPQNDLWIAALCVQHAMALYTKDKHFDYLPQLARV